MILACQIFIGLLLVVVGITVGCAVRNTMGDDGEIPLKTLDRWRARTEWREKRPKE